MADRGTRQNTHLLVQRETAEVGFDRPGGKRRALGDRTDVLRRGCLHAGIKQQLTRSDHPLAALPEADQ